MTINELLTQLNSLSSKLEPVAANDATFDLQILLLQVQKQSITEGFSPLTDLDALAPVSVGELRVLMAQADDAIATEKKRVQFVQTIIALAKTALRAAGVNLPAGL
jgi:hypothetical protein